MGWSIGYDERWKRDIGYGVPAICDYPNCGTKIDRGLSYVCGNAMYGGEHGCGLFFCPNHQYGPEQLCTRCAVSAEPFEPAPDVEAWNRHKATHESWSAWRQENGYCEDEGCPHYGTLHVCRPKEEVK